MFSQKEVSQNDLTNLTDVNAAKDVVEVNQDC